MGVMEGQKGGERDEVDKKDDQHLIIISWRDISQNCSIINSKEEKIKLFIIIKQLKTRKEDNCTSKTCLLNLLYIQAVY